MGRSDNWIEVDGFVVHLVPAEHWPYPVVGRRWYYVHNAAGEVIGTTIRGDRSHWGWTGTTGPIPYPATGDRFPTRREAVAHIVQELLKERP